MARRTSLFALLAVVVGSSLIVTSGAFSSVAAQRGANVAVTGDAGALLSLEPHTSANGQAYTTVVDGELQLRIDGTNTVGSGVNVDALTRIERVFNITNNGNKPVGVWIVKSGNHSSLLTFEDANGNRLDNSSTAAVTVSPGETVEVTVVIDTRNSGVSPGATILDGMTIHADAAEA